MEGIIILLFWVGVGVVIARLVNEPNRELSASTIDDDAPAPPPTRPHRSARRDDLVSGFALEPTRSGAPLESTTGDESFDRDVRVQTSRPELALALLDHPTREAVRPAVRRGCTFRDGQWSHPGPGVHPGEFKALTREANAALAAARLRSMDSVPRLWLANLREDPVVEHRLRCFEQLMSARRRDREAAIEVALAAEQAPALQLAAAARVGERAAPLYEAIALGEAPSGLRMQAIEGLARLQQHSRRRAVLDTLLERGPRSMTLELRVLVVDQANRRTPVTHLYPWAIDASSPVRERVVDPLTRAEPAAISLLLEMLQAAVLDDSDRMVERVARAIAAAGTLAALPRLREIRPTRKADPYVTDPRRMQGAIDEAIEALIARGGAEAGQLGLVEAASDQGGLSMSDGGALSTVDSG